MTAEAGTIWTIVVAGGSGSRFGGATPKQFIEIAGRRLLDWSVAAAASVSDGVVIVLPAGTTELSSSVDDHHLDTAISWVSGGPSRSESVRNGLAAVPDSADIVVVHDAARPLASPALFEQVVAAVRTGADAVVPVIGVVDTIRDLDGLTVDRDRLQAVQTPQGFSAHALRHAHGAGADATDDATLVANAGGSVTVVDGERWNIKVTEPDDAVVVDALLTRRLRSVQS